MGLIPEIRPIVVGTTVYLLSTFDVSNCAKRLIVSYNPPVVVTISRIVSTIDRLARSPDKC